MRRGSFSRQRPGVHDDMASAVVACTIGLPRRGGARKGFVWHTELMHRILPGGFELSIFSDGIYPLDGGAFFGVVPKVMWSKKVAADERNYCTAGLNSLLIRTGRETVLVETGMGNKLSERMRKFYGQPAKLLDNLAAGGVAPEDIDIVINSHLHFDHCGWNTVRDKNGKIVPTFPRAKYYAPRVEWEYARHPSERDSISFIAENYDPLVESGQMTLLAGGEEIVPGISVRIFPGHTAHMMGIIVQSPSAAKAARPGVASGTAEAVPFPVRHSFRSSDSSRSSGSSRSSDSSGLSDPSGDSSRLSGSSKLSESSGSQPPADRNPTTACYISDLIPTAAHIDLTWGLSFDLYPLQTIESKKEYYARAIPEKWITVFTHDPKIPWAYVEKDEAGKMIAKEVA